MFLSPLHPHTAEGELRECVESLAVANNVPISDLQFMKLKQRFEVVLLTLRYAKYLGHVITNLSDVADIEREMRNTFVYLHVTMLLLPICIK